MPQETTPETDPKEVEYSQQIVRLLKRVDKLSDELVKHLDVPADSRLAGDDNRTPHHSVSTYAYGQLLAALGCLQSFAQMSIREDANTISMTMSPYGGYALIRNALDAAGTVMWMLEPASSTGRVKRRLWLGVDEVKNWASFRRSIGRPWIEWKKAKRARLKEVAELAALAAWNPLKEEMPSMTSILEGLERHHSKVVMPWLSAWQLASGHAHGKLWAQVVSHDLNEMEGTRTDVGATFRVTIKFGMVAVLLFEAVQLIEVAGTRYIELLRPERPVAG
jgi:hypothetical protein